MIKSPEGDESPQSVINDDGSIRTKVYHKGQSLHFHSNHPFRVVAPMLTLGGGGMRSQPGEWGKLRRWGAILEGPGGMPPFLKYNKMIQFHTIQFFYYTWGLPVASCICTQKMVGVDHFGGGGSHRVDKLGGGEAHDPPALPFLHRCNWNIREGQ